MLAARFTHLLAALAALTLGATACTLPGGASDGPPGGTVSMSIIDWSGSQSASANAFFIAYLDTSNGSVASDYDDSWLGTGERETCWLVENDGAVLPVAVGKDVGTSVTLSSGTVEFELTSSGPGNYYANSITPEVAKEFSVEIPGNAEVDAQTWDAALDVPAALEVDGIVEGLTVATDKPTEITWTPVDADAILLQFSNSIVGMCVVSDDGSFEVPQEFANEIDASGYFTALAINEGKKNLEGRSVRLIGSTGVSNYYYASGTPAN